MLNKTEAYDAIISEALPLAGEYRLKKRKGAKVALRLTEAMTLISGMALMALILYFVTTETYMGLIALAMAAMLIIIGGVFARFKSGVIDEDSQYSSKFLKLREKIGFDPRDLI